jgi:hypothetical protein
MEHVLKVHALQQQWQARRAGTPVAFAPSACRNGALTNRWIYIVVLDTKRTAGRIARWNDSTLVFLVSTVQ